MTTVMRTTEYSYFSFISFTGFTGKAFFGWNNAGVK